MRLAEIFGGPRPEQTISLSEMQEGRRKRGYPEHASLQLEGREVEELDADKKTLNALLLELNTSYREGI